MTWNSMAIYSLNVNGRKVKEIGIGDGIEFKIHNETYKTDNGLFKINKNGEQEYQKSLNLTDMSQVKLLEALANNDTTEWRGSFVLSKNDIRIAIEKYKKGEFTEDMSEFLPKGCKLEKQKLSTKEHFVQTDLVNKNNSKRTTMRFGIDVQPTADDLYNGAKFTGQEKAADLFGQILGPSLNSKTLKKFDEMDDNELLAAIRAYNTHNIQYWEKHTLGDEDILHIPDQGMFADLNDEWGIGIKELHPRINRALNAMPEECKELGDYQKIQEILNSTDKNASGSFSKKDVKEIDALFARMLP